MTLNLPGNHQKIQSWLLFLLIVECWRDLPGLGEGGSEGLHGSCASWSISGVPSLVPTLEIAAAEQKYRYFSAPFNASRIMPALRSPKWLQCFGEGDLCWLSLSVRSAWIIPAASAGKATQAKTQLVFPKGLWNPTAAPGRLLAPEHSTRKTHKGKEQPKYLGSSLWQQPKRDIWEQHEN